MRSGQKVRAAFAAALTVALAGALLVVPTATAQPAATPFAEADFSATATGTVMHTHELQVSANGPRVVNADVAFSGATVDSTGLGAALLNEMSRTVQPAQAGKNSYARGSGVEAGVVLSPPSAENQAILAGKAEAAAPPTTGPVTREVPLNVQNVVFASTARGQATARWLNETCTLGADISRGVGYAENAQLLGSAGTADGLTNPILGTFGPSNNRGVSNSISRTALVPQRNSAGDLVGSAFGLVSETRQTIAPVTILSGQAQQTTIEFLGEWVLRVVATGIPGQSYWHYGPGETSRQTPILKTINAAGVETNILTFEQITGATGLAIPIPDNFGEIIIGEDPRAIGGNRTTQPTVSEDGTTVSAAVDVVRVRLTPASGVELADLRIGHMEVQAQVPAGGISCPLPVTKAANPEQVNVGQPFTTSITINNPYDCDLTDVRVTDVITTVGAARFRVTATNPTADQVPAGDSLANGTVIWNDVGPIAVGESRTISVTLDAMGGAGRIDDIASATGTLANCRGEDASVAGSAVSAAGAGLVGSSAPVRVPVGAVAGEVLARTGPAGFAAIFSGLLLMGLGLLGVISRRRLL